MVSALDDQVGRVVAALKKKDMRDNTLILFASDNGGPTSGMFATGARCPEERRKTAAWSGAKTPVSNATFAAAKAAYMKAECAFRPLSTGLRA